MNSAKDRLLWTCIVSSMSPVDPESVVYTHTQSLVLITLWFKLPTLDHMLVVNKHVAEVLKSRSVLEVINHLRRTNAHPLYHFPCPSEPVGLTVQPLSQCLSLICLHFAPRSPWPMERCLQDPLISCCSVAKSYLTLCYPWTTAHQASLSFTISQSLLKLMFIELVMPSNHLILRRPLLLLPSIFPSIRVFSNESALLIKWPKYWGFSFTTVILMNIQGWYPLGLAGLISLLFKGLLRVFSSTTIWKYQFVGAQPSLWSFSHIYFLGLQDHCRRWLQPWN